MLTEKLIIAARERDLLGGTMEMNRVNADALIWFSKEFPRMGVPNHIADGIEDLMDLPATEKRNRAICWIWLALLHECESMVFEMTQIKLFTSQRQFNVKPLTACLLRRTKSDVKRSAKLQREGREILNVIEGQVVKSFPWLTEK
jgi:hypothetical protein